MLVLAVDIDLAEHRKAHAVVRRAELADFVRGLEFLARELPAGEAEHHESFIPVLVVEILQALELRREAALARGVHHEHHRTNVIGEIALLAREGVGLEVRKSCHVWCNAPVWPTASRTGREGP